jgi:diketogulonate reductase-like aldo/keto reductase
MSSVPNIKLNNGIMMPQFGLGVWHVKSGSEAFETVKYALSVGYRLIDTAALYGNEQSVGEAIKASGVPREEIFVTTKLWNSDQGYESTLAAFKASCDRLGLDYVDLYLIHWPNRDTELIDETWQAFEKLYEDKLTRSIGVSNFKPHHLEKLLEKAKTQPVINQIELHPYHTQIETREYCKKHHIQIESWSPLMQGGEILSNTVVLDIAKKHNKTAAQVVLRWHIDNGLTVIPRSVTPSRIKENFEIFDFKLTTEEVEAINKLDQNRRIGPDPDSFGLRAYNSISKSLNFVKRKNHRKTE